MRYGRLVIKLLFAVTALAGISGCSAGKRPPSTQAPNSSVSYEEGADFVGVVKALDGKNSRITFYNVLMEAEEEYGYSGATAVYSKNGRDMSMAEISAGEVFEVCLDDAAARCTA